MTTGGAPAHEPDDQDPREAKLAEAVAEYHDLRLGGQHLESSEFCARYPELAPELRAELAELEGLGQSGEAAPPEDEALPATLSGYRIVAQLGKGGMGRVLLAFDDRLGRRVAIKTLSRRYRDNPQLRERFMQEARAMARLPHPNVATIYELGPETEEPHFVMEYIEGAPLTEVAKRLNPQHKAELMRKVALAVDFLHRHGVLHRDLKPGNILVGVDLEPKVLDFGLALDREDARRITSAGDLLGTPAYFSPEQTSDGKEVDVRSDVFSLGVVFYELLTGVLPFAANSLDDLMQQIRQRDPILPRRLDPSIEQPLQDICLKALEKDPAERYASAYEFAADLGRYLVEEPVIANPSAYKRLMEGTIRQHLRELDQWRKERILSEVEFEGFRKRYDRLTEREDAWIFEMRRLVLPQVSLYLGAWLLAVGAGLVLLFKYASLAGTRSVLTVASAAAATCWLGIYSWRRDRLRIAIGFLLAFCLLLPAAYLVAMTEWGWLTTFTRGRKDLEFFAQLEVFKTITNAQLWWGLLLSLPAYYGLRRFTRASVFSLVLAFMLSLLCLVTLLRMGLLDWEPGVVYFRLLPLAVLFFVAGIALEALGRGSDSRYFYPFAVIFTFVGLSGAAARYQPLTDWLGRHLRWTHGREEYLFMANAAIYQGLQYLSERLRLPQMKNVAKAFRFVVPGHVLTTLLLLGLYASGQHEKGQITLFEVRVFEVILPLAACAFIFGSIPRQAKNYFASGLLFLAIGVLRLQQGWLKDLGAWPISLLFAGMALMLLAANYSAVRIALRRIFRRL